MKADLAPRPVSDRSALRLPRAAWETSPRAERVRARLGESDAYLAEARKSLRARPSDHLAALTAVLASFRASLLAFLNDYGATPDPEGVLATLGERAVRSASVLKTPVHRALLLVARAPAIRQAVRLSVYDRADVETGCYTARNLVQTVRTALPAALAARALLTPRAPEAGS